MEKWEHCVLVGKTITVLGKGLFKKGARLTESGAWNELGNSGWQLVSVVPDRDGNLQYFFKRQVSDDE